MLFHVRMDVAVPHDFNPEVRANLIAAEKARCEQLQRAGTWIHIWRVVGQYANISIFDVESSDALHDILWSLPLFPFMHLEVTALTRHPSTIDRLTGG
jgi:muconolactone D-isomerase